MTSNFLTVDEGVRPRANSDPTAGACFLSPSMMLPEITVEDCTDTELFEINNGRDEGGLFGMDATPRRRANTCPEDLFRKRNGRPPTPPPSTFRRGSRFKSGFTKPVMRESVSFIHHKLSKLAEDTGEANSQTTPQTSGMERLASEQPPSAVPQSSEASSTPDSNRAQSKDDSAPVVNASSRLVSSGQVAKVAAVQRSNDCINEAGRSPTANRAEEASSDSEASNGTESHFRSKSASVDCRYSGMTKPRGLDGAQLQAC